MNINPQKSVHTFKFVYNGIMQTKRDYKMNNKLRGAFTKLAKSYEIINQGKYKDTLSTRCRNSIIDFDEAAETIRTLDAPAWEALCRDLEWHIETNGGDVAS